VSEDYTDGRVGSQGEVQSKCAFATIHLARAKMLDTLAEPMLRRILNTALRRGVKTAVQATAETAASATTKSFVQVFEISLPATVYVRASMCELTVRYNPGRLVELSANLRAAFGWELVADQDEAGVYIVAKRKLLVGQLSSATFSLTVPPEANLVFHLTPGTVKLIGIDGKLSILGVSS
jgi:hypothetical protein